ncbi:Phenazine biosynthesis-like domain-containing protein [Seminavis robusta]|uniref:Phenazine biosynthesis-like domain-containing protein n=1 Tax=Seminavis robusta TaxID=568900 RepID=A0A9N8DJ87_9STRA|nr:Phenazine biosynthesis-like domain-containing protein [Seminavis robusta]|eukprot:Sro188_g081160.1 Phenazine biosynthesis-like domain-containing protein (551) ;mRNA; f:31847-33499
MSISKQDGSLENGALGLEPSNESVDGDHEDDDDIEEEEELHFCMVRPADIPRCVAIEKASYPPSEAASKSSLQYRQHHAAPYFRCAYMGSDDDDKEVIGFICATRCHEFDHESMSTHHSEGPLLAIHSVVVTEEHRRKGVATAMLKDYIEQMRIKADGVQKLVLMSKKQLLAFYVDCGFSVIKPSSIVHGDDQWYDLELDLSAHKSIGRPYYIVDSFANVDVPGSGNPAAVVILKSTKDNVIDPNEPQLLSWMLIVAKEFNLSETAYVWLHEDHKRGQERHWYIRYFTPTVEVDLCGHATLAAAGILYRTMSERNAGSNNKVVVFHAKEDILTTTLAPAGLKVVKKRPATKIAMKFPAKEPKEITEEADVEAVQKILWEAFKVPSDVILFIGLSDIGDVFVELTPDAFDAIGYDNIQYNAFLQWDGYTRGVVVCCEARPPSRTTEKATDLDETASVATSTSLTTAEGDAVESLDFFSRFFGPKAGINEDPATGSAHCSLGPYFSKKLGKEHVVGKQASERGGIVECHVDGDSSVTISGVAVQTMTGNLLL